MPAQIFSTDPGSIAMQLGFEKGDTLVSINDHDITDVIDYMYYSESEKLQIKAICGGKHVEFDIEKDMDEPLGMNFESYLIDSQKSCKNKCIFCFIDQLPKGLRPSLYFKDDDARLSFLMGNYITLTNLSENDIERICNMRISPINISVHSTDPELRVKMMKNPNAAKINDIMLRFAKAGISMNCQIVLCKNINDGDNLIRTLSDLKALYPSVLSVGIVPVGLTRFRQGLFPLKSFTPSDCAQVIQTIERMADECKKQFGVRLFYPSDEFFIKGGLPLPKEDYYDGYPQIENGIGLCTSLLSEVDTAVNRLSFSTKPSECAIITGTLPVQLMKSIVTKISTKRPALNCTIYPIINHFFGEQITVAGLVTATDIIDQLKDRDLPKRLLIPSSMLRSQQDMFLDSITIEQLEHKLNRKLTITHSDGFELVEKIIDERI